jgi:hypothetical protein
LEFRIVNQLYNQIGGETVNGNISLVATVDPESKADSQKRKALRSVERVEEVWIVRHRLDEKSPLLSTMAKRMIHESGGNWPQSLNHNSKVRQHLQFHQLIVTFSGTCRASGKNSYAHKVYDIVDVNIGYRFAHVLVKKKKKMGP